MNNITIILPVSRDSFLDKLFASLEFLACDSNTTSLLVVVDGDSKLFTKTRNFVEMSKFSERLCVQLKSDESPRKYDIVGRRVRIANIHNEFKKHISNAKYIFGVEDDTIVPANALNDLLRDYRNNPFAGFIQGVEIGRWGIPYVGAWKADDVYNPQKIESLSPNNGVQPVDAGGFYCFLTKAEIYMAHEFKTFENNNLGPDVDFGISLRQQGYENYTNWDIKCTHKSDNTDITFLNTVPRNVTFIKKNNRWRQSQKST